MEQHRSGKKMSGTNRDTSPNRLSMFVSRLKHILIYSQPSNVSIMVFILVALGIFLLLNDLLPTPSRRFQDHVAQELRALPVPPGSIEKHFSSGFQPGKGMAERTIVSRLSEKQLCAFYRLMMAKSGWQLVHEGCYSSYEFHNVMEYQKGPVDFRIGTTDQYGTNMNHEYALFSSWAVDPGARVPNP